MRATNRGVPDDDASRPETDQAAEERRLRRYRLLVRAANERDADDGLWHSVLGASPPAGEALKESQGGTGALLQSDSAYS